MAISGRKRVYKQFREGELHFQALSLPVTVETGREHSFALSRLLLSDPTGEIPREELLRWLKLLEELIASESTRKGRAAESALAGRE